MAKRTPRQWAVYYLIYLAMVGPWLVLIIFWIMPRSHLVAYLVEGVVIFGALTGADKLERIERRRRHDGL